MSQISKPVFCHGCKQTRSHHSIYPMKQIVYTFLKLGVDADKELRCPVCLFRTECESDAELTSQSMKEESSTVSGTTSPKTVSQTLSSSINSTQQDSSPLWNQTLWMGALSLEPEEHDATRFSSTNSAQQDSPSSWNQTLWMGDLSLESEEHNATRYPPLCQTASFAFALSSTRRESSSEVNPCGSSPKNECESDAELTSQSMKEETSTVSGTTSPKAVSQTSSSSNSTQQDSSSSWNQTLWMGALSLEPEEHDATRFSSTNSAQQDSPSSWNQTLWMGDLSHESEEHNATRYPPLCQTASFAFALSSTRRESSSEVNPCGSPQKSECESDAELTSQSMKEESSTVSSTTSPKTVSETSSSSTNSTQQDSSSSWNQSLSSKLPLWMGALSLEQGEHNATRHPSLCQTASSAVALSSTRRESSSEDTPCGSSQKFTSDPEHGRQHPDNLSVRHLKTVERKQQTKASTPLLNSPLRSILPPPDEVSQNAAKNKSELKKNLRIWYLNLWEDRILRQVNPAEWRRQHGVDKYTATSHTTQLTLADRCRKRK